MRGRKPKRKARLARSPLKRGRTPLKRSKGLAPGSGFKGSGKPLARRTGLRTRSGRPGFGRGTVLQTEAYEAARAAWIASTVERAHRRGQGYVCPVCKRTRRKQEMDGHHVIEARAIRGYVRSLRLPYEAALILLTRLLWDPRVGVAVCRDCHAAHSNASVRLPRSILDSGHVEFAREVGRERDLDRYYE